jgi:hypothetical protein
MPMGMARLTAKATLMARATLMVMVMVTLMEMEMVTAMLMVTATAQDTFPRSERHHLQSNSRFHLSFRHTRTEPGAPLRRQTRSN